MRDCKWVICCLLWCLYATAAYTQTNEPVTYRKRLFKEGLALYQGQNHIAAIVPLKTFLNDHITEGERETAEYIICLGAYKTKDIHRKEFLLRYLEDFPDSPYYNNALALTGSCFYFEEDFTQAIEYLEASRLDLLTNRERDEYTYQLAESLLKTGQTTQAAIWFSTLLESGSDYREESAYHLAYIRYTQQRYDDALEAFSNLTSSPRYQAPALCYIADIHARMGNDDKAKETALRYLEAYPNSEQAGHMWRVLGQVYYRGGQYHKAAEALERYKQDNTPRRDALYMLGFAYYQTGAYGKAILALEQVATRNDALTQNACLHLGYSFIQTGDLNRARMAFERACGMDTDAKLKEEALYNYALCVYQTSFSAFGESILTFEKFLNEYPQSVYNEKISEFLTEIYLNTRSYDAALASISRIKKPNTKILAAKQKILFRLGSQQFANARFEQAVDYLSQCVALGTYHKPTSDEALYWRGEAYYRLGNMDAAERDYTTYTRVSDPGNTYPLVYYNLGYIAFNKQRYTRAASYFKNYVAKGTNKEILADAYNRLGDCYLQIRDFKQATSYYSKAEQDGSTYGDYSFYQMALVLGLEKDYAGKITLLNRLMGKYPSSTYMVQAMYEKGRAYVMMGNNTQAVHTFEELMGRYPENALSRKASAEIGLLYYQEGDYERAIKAYKHTIAKYQGSEEAKEAMQDLRSLYVRINKVDEYAAFAGSLPGGMSLNATEQDSLTYIAAEQAYQRSRTEEAKASFISYLNAYPQGSYCVNAHYYLYKIGMAQKNQELTLTHAQRLLEYPDNPYTEETLIGLADTQLTLGRAKEALENYRTLKEKSGHGANRTIALKGIISCTRMTGDDNGLIEATTELLAESKLDPEHRNEALYHRGKAYLRKQEIVKALDDLNELGKDTRSTYGAEAGYLAAETMYRQKDYTKAEQALLTYIEQSTPHAYWLARCFVLLADVYLATNRGMEAKQYLLSLQQNYKGNDNIAQMIEERLNVIASTTAQ